ncbi:MAG: amidohydrolase family protein [Acidimicrobiales bacterium]
MTEAAALPCPVFDADGHICEPAAVWTDYAEPRYRDQILQLRRSPAGRDTLWAEGRDRGVNVAPACVPGAFSNAELTWDAILPGSFDPLARQQVLDEEGLAEVLLFPSVWLLSGDIEDPAVAAASTRAYNNWIADFVKAAPERLHAMGVCPLQGVDEAVAEIERIAALGLSGCTFRPERYHGRELAGEEMDPVWAAAAGSGLAVGVHGSFGSRMPGLARTRWTNQFHVHMVCHPFEQMAAVLDVIAGGVLDRFPSLRIGFFESGMGWLPYWIERFDEHQRTMGHLVPTLRRRPSEAFAEQCFITMEAGEAEALGQVHELGLSGCVLWGSDYPHYDCTYPGALAELEASLAEVGAPGLRERVLWANPRRFLGLT